MPKEISNNELAKLIADLPTKKDYIKLNKKIDELPRTTNKSFTELEGRMNLRFDKVNKQLYKLEKGQEKLTTEQIKMKDVMKRMASKDDLNKANNDIISKIDGLAAKHKKFESESAANLGAHERMQGEIDEARQILGLEPTIAIDGQPLN